MGKVENILKTYSEFYAPVADEIKENTEKYRKSEITLSVRTPDGKPYSGKVHVTQTASSFEFGSNCVMLGQLGDLNEAYESSMAHLFNLMTTTFCWAAMETAPGVYRFEEGCEEISRRPPSDRVLNYGKKYGLKLKGQPLLADSWYPDWASRDKETLEKQYLGYFSKVADRYGDNFDYFDLTNESNYCPKRTPGFPLLSKDGPFDYVRWAFRQARPLFAGKKAKLCRNEGSEVNAGMAADRYFEQNRQLIEEGIPMDAIGYQFHLFNHSGKTQLHLRGDYLTPESIYETYKKASTLGKDLYISEITVPTVYEDLSYEEGCEVQAQITELLYRLWFSVPKMKGIVWWNFRDGPAWKSEGNALGGLVREDMTPKPVYERLENLILKEWRTEGDFEAADGKVTFRGFPGTYQVDLLG